MKQNNKGFSLVEVVVAIAILGAFSVSICTSLVLSLRMNEKTNTLMQEQLAVSSAVETLMATGISDPNTIELTGVSVSAVPAMNGEAELPYYEVTVTGEDGNVTVTTQIRKVAPKTEVTE